MENLFSYIYQHPAHFLFIATGLTIRYLINRRRFARRGIGGLQHYGSFGVGLVTILFEWILKTSALLMIVLAVIGLLIGK